MVKSSTVNHEFWILRDTLKMVVFLVFLGFYTGFGGLSWFLMVFRGFYSGFELLTAKSTVKTKKNHQFWILRDPLKMVVFLVLLDFYSGFGGLSWFLVVFLGFTVVSSS